MSAHFFSGVAIFAVASTLSFVPKNLLWLSIIIVFSMVQDADILVFRLHRNAFTHTPVFWIAMVALILGLVGQSAWILIPTILLHLFLDTLDYGIMVLYPFSRKKFGLALLKKGIVRDSDSLTLFVKEYLSNRKLVFAESGIALVSLFLVLIRIL